MHVKEQLKFWKNRKNFIKKLKDKNRNEKKMRLLLIDRQKEMRLAEEEGE
jgi:hypothetical protein